VLDAALEGLGAESGTLHLLDEARGLLLLQCARGIPESVLEKTREIPMGRGMAGQAAATAGPVTTCNLQTDDAGGAIRPGARASGLGGVLCVPILAGARVVGTLGVGTRGERTFTPEETTLLLEVGRLVGARHPAGAGGGR
jgi:GAF domain-containing protein